MAFDLSTAKPIDGSSPTRPSGTRGFDLSTARPIDDSDVTSNADEGALAAGTRGAVEAVVPGFAGLAGFGAGMKAAAPTAARAAAATPGPAIAKGLVGGAVALTGGFAGAFGASSGAAWVQNKLYAIVDPEGYKNSQTAKEQHPTASAIGSVAGGLAGMSPKTIPEIAGKFFTKPIVQRSVSAGLTGTLDVGQQAATEDSIDWARAGAAAAGGFAAPGFNPAGKAAYDVGGKLVPGRTAPGGGTRTPTDSTEAPKPLTPNEAGIKKNEDSLIREFELGTNPNKQLDQAAFLDTKTGEYIKQGARHDELLKKNPDLVAGFLLKDGTFATREEAAVIAKDQHADKLVNEIDPKRGLHSDDFGPERMDALKPKEEATTSTTTEPGTVGLNQPFVNSNRVIAITEVNGVRVPFYISTGSGGKASVPAGKWYPFFGIAEDGWFNKGSEQNINDFYGSAALKAKAEELNKLHGDIRNRRDDGTLPSGAITDVNEGLTPASNGSGGALKNIKSLLERINKAQSPAAKSAAEELGVRTDTRKNFYEDLDKNEFRLAMLTEEMDNRVNSMSTQEQFAANKEIKDLEKKIEAARKEAPVFESKGQIQFRIESIPPEQRNLQEQQQLDALKQLGKHDSRKLDWEDTHDLLRGSKSATEGLQRIVDGGHASWPLVQLSKLLLKNHIISDAKVSVHDYEKPYTGKNAGPKDITLGDYDSTLHSIGLYKGGDIQTYLHETIHAAVYALQKDGTHASAKALKKLYEDYKSTTSEKTQKDVYGLTDELEFLAEAFTNPKFQRLLHTRYMLGNPSKTMWQEFKDVVKDSLGIKKQSQGASALDQVLNHGAVLLEEGFVTSEKTSSKPTYKSHTEFINWLTGSGEQPASKSTATSAAASTAVDPDRYNPRKVTDEADLKLKGKELYASKGEAAAREFIQGYERYKQDWLDPVKFVEDAVDINLNNQMAIRRNVTNNAERLKEMVPDAATREQVAIAIDAKKTDTLTGPAKALADKYTSDMKDIGERALKEGVVKGLLTDYVTHIVNWADMPKGALDTFLSEVFKRAGDPTKKTTTESRFGMERKIETFTQLERVLADINDRIALAGKDFKLEIKTKDIAEIYKQYGLSMEKAIENKKLVESVLSTRNPAGESLIRRVTDEAPLPRGWEMINDRQFAGYAVHPDLVPALKFAFENKTGTILNGLYTVSQAVKRLNVIASFFHAKSLLEVQSSTGIPLVTPLKEVGLGIVDKVRGTEVSGIRKAVEQFKKGGLGDSVDKWIRGGLVLEIPQDVKIGVLGSIGKFSDSMIGKFGPKTHILESALTTTEKYTLGITDKVTWDYLHTGGKLYVADKYLERARIDAGKKGIPFDEAASRKEITSFVNKAFGGLNWFQEARSVQNEFGKRMAMAAYSPEGRKYLQLLLFAPDWTISTIKAFTAALPKELNPLKMHPIEGIRGMATPSTQADYARLYQFKTAITYLTLLNGINLLTADRPIWENKDPTRIEFDDGTSMQAMKHAMEPYHWIADPAKTLTNKLGFLPKAAIVATTGLEYPSPYAPKMVDPSAANRAVAVLKMGLPFQVNAAMSAPEGEGAKRALLGTLGVPVYGSTPAQKKATNKERNKQIQKKNKEYREREREAGR